jgi:hypothetical protein
MVDAASRASRKVTWLKVESSRLKVQRERRDKDNAETQRAQRWRGDDEVVGKGGRLRFTRHDSTIVTICQ